MRLNVLKNHVSIIDVTVETPDPSERYEIYVGRAEDCHVRIEDPLISRHHFVIKNEDGVWYVEKLSQLGQLSLNGVTGNKMQVKDGSEVQCADYSFFLTGFPVSTGPAFFQPQVQSEINPLASAPSKESIPDPVQEWTPPEEMKAEKKKSDDILLVDEVIPEDQYSSENNIKDELENAGFDQLTDLSEESGSFGTESGDLTPYDEEGSSSLVDENSSNSNDEKTQFLKSFVNYQLILFGDYAPYDRYAIDQDEVYIGRDSKKCQIILDDPEVSSVHAVIRKNNIEITLEDLNSSNGTIFNGERINKANISTGDEFLIGSTSFILETRSDLLEAESDRLMPVEKGQVIEREEIEEEEVDLNSESGEFQNVESAKGPLAFWKNAPPKKKLIYGVGLILLLLVLLNPEEPENIPVTKTDDKEKNQPNKDEKSKIQISKEQEELRNQSYELGVNFFEQEKYHEAETEFKKVVQIDPEYKKVQTYLEQTIAGLKRLEEIAAQERAEKERIAIKKQIEELLVKAREAVKEKQVTVAESFFSQILEKDPENIDVQQLKLEIEAWQKEEERKAMEIAAKEAARKAMVDALSPGKTFYLKREWYKSILKLEEFLRRKGSDEDLVKEASDMLSDAKNQLSAELGPLIGKARSLKEGQDLRSAYESYLEILKIEPTNAEALNEVDEIKSQLETRSKRIYREAIISESLSLFTDAKEKFQEVQQISPTDSEYYKKASDKLKNYLE